MIVYHKTYIVNVIVENEKYNGKLTSSRIKYGGKDYDYALSVKNTLNNII